MVQVACGVAVFVPFFVSVFVKWLLVAVANELSS